MISRRLVRIKAMQTYYGFLQNSGDITTEQIWKELKLNIEKSHELYIFLHCLLISIIDYAELKIDIAKKKLVPSIDDLSPNKKFIENKIIESFRKNDNIISFYNTNNFNWSEYPDFIKNTWNQIVDSSYYKEYMLEKASGITSDKNILIKIINKTLTDNYRLDEILEEKSIYWNDDLEFLLSNIIQNIKKFTASKNQVYNLQPLFKNKIDEKFAKDLIIKTSINKDKYDQIILESLKKWELERIAFTDRILLHLALCEINEFPDMPVKVTINEYLDIAKFYSTDKSSIFINGILDKIYAQLKSNNKLNKKGLGLVE